MSNFKFALFSIFLIVLMPLSAAAQEASVSAQKSPIKLTLTLHSKKIRLGDPLWFRLKLTNVSKVPIEIVNGLFCSDYGVFKKSLESYAGLRKELYLVVVRADGKEVMNYYPIPPIDGCIENESGSMGSMSKESPAPPEIQRKVDQWKKEGLNNQQIQAKLDKEFNYNPDYHPPGWKEKPYPCSAFELAPSKSVETPAWVFKGYCPGDRPHLPMPPGRFVEAIQFQLDKPAHYRVFAVYNVTSDSDTKKLYRELHMTPSDGYVKTPAINFEVTP